MQRVTRRRMLSYLGATAFTTLPVSGCEFPDFLSGHLRAPFGTSFDVVIVGATPSGIIAAMAAIRVGAQVAVIESTQHIGGLYSNGLGAPNFWILSTIGGLQKRFYKDLGIYYGSSGGSEYYFEPHAAEEIFIGYMAPHNVSVFLGRTVASVKKIGTRIVSLTLDNGAVITGTQWIDASYEGDLMAASGAAWTVGRESTSQFGERFAGWGHQNMQTFPRKLWDGSLLPGLNPDPQEAVGQADKKIMAYTFFATLTSDASNRGPLPKPPDYSPSQFAAQALCIKANNLTKLEQVFDLQDLHHKNKYCVLLDVSNGEMLSSDYAGASWDYPAGDWATRKAIYADHFSYVAGLLYFLANDPSVPASIQNEMKLYGPALDEYTDNNNWPWQMYIREGRRLVGKYVMTEPDLISNPTKSDAVGLNNWPIDCHPCDAVATTCNGEPAIALDGGLFQQDTVTYELPFSSMLPNPSEVTNLAVTVCLSASHIAFSSMRVEPCYITLGEAAGTAAGIALKSRIDLSEVNIQVLQNTLRNYGGVINLPT